ARRRNNSALGGLPGTPGPARGRWPRPVHMRTLPCQQLPEVAYASLLSSPGGHRRERLGTVNCTENALVPDYLSAATTATARAKSRMGCAHHIRDWWAKPTLHCMARSAKF